MLTETELGAMRVRMLSREIHKRGLCYLLSIGDGNTIVITVRMKGSDSSSYNWWLPAST